MGWPLCCSWVNKTAGESIVVLPRKLLVISIPQLAAPALLRQAAFLTITPPPLSFFVINAINKKGVPEKVRLITTKLKSLDQRTKVLVVARRFTTLRTCLTNTYLFSLTWSLNTISSYGVDSRCTLVCKQPTHMWQLQVGL